MWILIVYKTTKQKINKKKQKQKNNIWEIKMFLTKVKLAYMS